MSGPKHSDRSAPSMCPRNMPQHWSICWSMRFSIADLLRCPRRTTPSRSRRCCGASTDPRSTPWPGLTSQRILDAERRLVISAGRRDGSAVNESAVDLALLEMAANSTALDAGQASLVRRMCTSAARLQLAIAPAGAGKTTAMRALVLAGRKTEVRCSAWLRRLPRPPSSQSKPGSALTHWPSSPSPSSTVSCRAGRPRSGRQHW
jgi:AAA domain